MLGVWNVNAGNVFLWVFSLAMGNLMSWTISVDGLEFHDISMEHQTQLNSSMMKQKLTQQVNLCKRRTVMLTH